MNHRTAIPTMTAGLLAALLAGCSATTATLPDATSEPGAGQGAAPTTQHGGQGGPDGTPGAAPEGSAASRPTPAELAAARADVARLSDRELAGQTVVAAVAEPTAATAVRLVRDLHLGGVIVLEPAVPTDGSDPVGLIDAIHSGAGEAFAAQGRNWPPIIAVDQEGGSVARLRAPLTQFPAAMAVGAAGRSDLARGMGRASGTELRAAGFTVVFAPDADVTRGASDVAIGDRSIGGDPADVTRLAGGLLDGYADAGIVSVLKHFPGHGSLTTDSHVDLPVLPGDMATLEQTDLSPFATLARRGAPGVMVGHIGVAALDADTPASLSRPVITDLLRGRLGFDGLVVTDSLRMGAVTRRYGPAAAAVAALQAGADVVLMPADPAAAVEGIAQAIRSERLPRERVEAAAATAVATLRHVLKDRPARTVVGAHQAVADELARGSIVQLSGPCGARLVGDAVTFVGGTPEGRGYLEDAARAAGLRVAGAGGTTVALVGGPQYWAGLKKAGEVRGTTADVVVSTDNPAYLSLTTARTAKLAVFGRGPATYNAIVAVLTGTLRAPGKLPVAIDGAARGSGC